MSRTLIEKLRSSMYRLQRGEYEQGYNAGVTKSISIVRQHEVEHPQELVERATVAFLIAARSVSPYLPEGSCWPENVRVMHSYDRFFICMKAAITAIGESKSVDSSAASRTLASEESAGASPYPPTNPGITNRQNFQGANRGGYDLNAVQAAACTAGFSLDTSYGEGEDRRRPVSDLRTLCRFIDALALPVLMQGQPISIEAFSIAFGASVDKRTAGTGYHSFKPHPDDVKAGLDAAGVSYE